MAANESFPPELLIKIFRLARQADESFRSRWFSTIRAALTCRSWRRPAQAVLWEDVCIETAAGLASFLAATTQHGFSTSRLHLNGNISQREIGVKAARVSEALERCRDLTYLSLFYMENLDYRALCGPQLAGITELEIGFSTFAPQTSFQSLPFNVSSLTFRVYDAGRPRGGISHWSEQLVASLLRPSITNLNLTLPCPSSNPAAFRTIFTNPLSTLAPHLISLDLNLFNSARTLTALAPFLRRCTSLEIIVTLDEGVLATLPTPIKVWTSCAAPNFGENNEMERSIVVLGSGVVALSKLEKVIFQYVHSYYVDRACLEELEDVCRLRGVELVLAGEI